MERRSFLKNSLATGALLTVNSCATDSQKTPQSTDHFPLNEITIRELIHGYEAGTSSCEKVTQQYLKRIESIDKSGATLCSVIQLNPDAIEQARELDSLRKSGTMKGPLHGIPVLLKDNINTAGNMNTTAGSLALKNNKATKNAFVAQKLIDAGALILGKTNLSEWANFRSTRSSSGWSAVGGQTRNPYFLDRSPCGSSSGSGVAVSANLCSFAIGTETDGSIVCPATINGIVGVKPTLGLVSRAGIVPIAHSHDTAGPMTRSVTDAAIVLGVLAGVDENDPYTKRSIGKGIGDYTSFLKTESLNGSRIGIARTFFGFHEKVDELMEKAIVDIRGMGATMVEMEKDELHDLADEDAYAVLLYEFKHDLKAYLSTCGAAVTIRSLDDLIAFNEANKDQEMPYFTQEVFMDAQNKGPLTDPEYLNALDNVLKSNGENGIDKAIKAHALDAIIAPTGGPAWTIDMINGDHYRGGSSSPAARSGYPSITVPMGFVHGLPVGISFFASAFSESTLIGLAFAYEQATKFRRPPTFQSSFNGH